jgi:Carotenoid biosynthesis protein
MQYLFDTPIPAPWLLADLLSLAITVLVIIFIIKKSRHPVVILLESFSFVLFYASIYENFAVVQGWYVYGHALLMVGDVPLSVPLLEVDVLIAVLWLLEKMEIPVWCKPFIVGLFGTLQDFSLDPYAVRQVFTVNGLTRGRWSWLLHEGAANIFGVPVYNFSGWTLIMFYATIFILIGRWWYRRSGYKPVVGYVYPFLMIFLALLAMVSPISQFLLWLGPFFSKGSNAEWIMLSFHLIFPVLLLILFWRGRMKYSVTLKEDLHVFAVVGLFHLSDILFTLVGSYTEILWLVVLTSIVHWALLGWIYVTGRKIKMPRAEFIFGA